jgi:hypothetical protein
MAKNPKKYRYLEVGLAWDSWTLSQLTEDARLHQMEEQPAKLAALRLTEYYRLVSLGVIVPGVTALQPKPTEPEVRASSNGTQRPAAMRNGKSTSVEEQDQASRRSDAPEAVRENILLEESSDVGLNADAALSFFLDEEEGEEGNEA